MLAGRPQNSLAAIRARHSPFLACVGAIVLGILASARLPAEGVEKNLENAGDWSYTSQSFQSPNRLPGESVQSFAQTPDGFLWVGTSEGLLRFDGASYVRFSHENTPAMREDSVFCLLAARNGRLWIGTDGGGLIEMHDGVFRLYTAADGLTDVFIRALYEDHAGSIWIATDSGLFRESNGKVERIDNRPGMPAGAFHGLYQDREGRIWAGAAQLYAITNAGPIPYTLGGEDNQHRVKSVIETYDRSIWVGTVSGLYRMLPGHDAFTRVSGVSGTVRTLREVIPGELWAGTIGQGIFRIRYGPPGEKISQLTAPSPLVSNTVLSIFADDSNNLWIGTEVGLTHMSRTPIHVLLLPGAADSDFGTVSLDRDGSLWAAANQLVHLKGDRSLPVRIAGLGSAHVRNVLRTRDGTLWFGTDGSGLFKVESNHTAQITTAQGLVNNFIRVMMEGRDGTLWIGTDAGVSHLKKGAFHNITMDSGLSHFSIRSMMEDRNGDIWVGTERGVTHLHNETPVHDTVTEALKNEKVWAEHADLDGGLWFGTRTDGLYRYRDGALFRYTTANGLASNSISAILEDSRRNFWLSGPLGVMLLDRGELDDLAEHRDRPISVHFYRADAGERPTRFYGGTQSAGAITATGEVWFPTNVGLWRIRPSELEAPPVSHLSISAVRVDGRSVSPEKGLTLAAGQSRLEIDFEPVLLSSQEGLRFRYRMRGFDPDWTETGSQQRSATYTNLPPGDYTFAVQGWELGHPNHVVEASLSLTKQPHFYRTAWFVALCLVVVGMISVMAYRLRMRQIHARFEAVLAERSRLAREMHDTLIQGCASVSAMLEGALSCESDDHESRTHMIDYANTQIRATMDEARQAVWNLRKGEQAPTDLARGLKQMGERLGREYGVHVSLSTQGESFPMGQQATHELMMVAREAFFNSVLHGHPREIVADVSFSAETLHMVIVDDGEGFDPAAVPSDGHYGLQGLQERVSRLGGRVEIRTKLNQGTRLSVSVPRDKVTVT